MNTKRAHMSMRALKWESREEHCRTEQRYAPPICSSGRRLFIKTIVKPKEKNVRPGECRQNQRIGRQSAAVKHPESREETTRRSRPPPASSRTATHAGRIGAREHRRSSTGPASRHRQHTPTAPTGEAECPPHKHSQLTEGKANEAVWQHRGRVRAVRVRQARLSQLNHHSPSPTRHSSGAL